MANIFEKITFLAETDDILSVNIQYKVQRPVESPMMRLSMPFVLSVSKNNPLPANFWFDALEDSLVNPLLQILGKNVKISSMELVNQTKSTSLKLPYTNLYGMSETNSDPKNSLLFELLVRDTTQALRVYLRAPSNAFAKMPLDDKNAKLIGVVEEIFVQPVTLNDSIYLQYKHQQKTSIIAANLKSIVVAKPKEKSKTKLEERYNTSTFNGVFVKETLSSRIIFSNSEMKI